MEQYYSDEKNVQILIALMKAHGIKRIVASPGSTNVTFVGSVQQDPFFEIYSCVDERSAAYMACGMAAHTGEPVALSCTGATASRNYFSALTEAYYRKLPVLAITSTQDRSRLGHLITQTIDRFSQPNDVVKTSVYLQNVKDSQDEWDCMIKANKAILELNHRGMGPAHINLATSYSHSFKTKQLPPVTVIKRYTAEDNFPTLPHGRIAIFVGSHLKWDDQLTMMVDNFCERHHAVVFTDPTANYCGKYGVSYELASYQDVQDNNNKPDLLIHIGNMSDMNSIVQPRAVWRLAEDGEISDRYQKLRCVFEMKELTFFQYYSQQPCAGNEPYLDYCRQKQDYVLSNVPDLPFSHLWIAQQMSKRIPKDAVIHYGILSPLRSWGYFMKSGEIEAYCNQGGFGIDGNMSTLIGASLMNPQRLFFGVFGDLSFFYDLNSLGNRHVSNNLRILLINNSLGAEFHLYKQLNSIYVNDVDKYISAGGHNGHQSPELVKNFVTALGFEYISASSKEEFMENVETFVSPQTKDRPLVFEVFTKVSDENDALFMLRHIEKSTVAGMKSMIKNLINGGDAFNTVAGQKYKLSLENTRDNN